MENTLKLENAKLKEEVERLKILANYDTLCAVYNRRVVKEKIDTILSEKHIGALLVIDLDRFKLINDYFGHLIGDEALKKISQVLLQLTKKQDIVGRIGGDEFIVFINETITKDEVNKRIEILKTKIMDIQIQKEETFILSVSIFSSTVQDGDTYEILFNRADQRLVKYKRTRQSNLGVYRELKDNYYDFEMFCLLEQRCKDTPYHLLLLSISKVDTDSSLSKDEAMKELFNCIQYTLRRGDFFTRYSTNQFVVLCKYIKENNLMYLKERIDKLFKEKINNQYALTITKMP